MLVGTHGAQMGRLIPDVVAARKGCDVQACGDGGENNNHPRHDACVLEPEESRHDDLELHSSASCESRPTFFDGQLLTSTYLSAV